MSDPKASVETALRMGPYTIRISNTDKLFYPDSDLTKGDVVEYYRRIAPTMLRHVRGRPVTLQRFPDGLEGEGFYQKNIGDHFPGWIHTVRIPKKTGGTLTQLTIENAATLVFLADQAVITPHVWPCRADRLQRPDRMIFDLDPPDAAPAAVAFAQALDAARALRELLSELGLRPYVMTTGSRGLHVMAPIRRGPGFDDVRRFAGDVATLLARRSPRTLTVEQRKDRRGSRLFLDTNRNGYAQTAAAPYALRARPGAPVATPIDWRELSDPELASDRHTLRTIFRRLGQRADAWKDAQHHGRSLRTPRERLDRLLGGTPD